MKKILMSSIAVVAVATMGNAQYINKQSLDIFPKAKAGMQQFVIELPHASIEDDNNKKLEIIVGKNTQVDKCNIHHLMGTMEVKDLQGWGYQYYEFNTKGDIRSTMIGCVDTESVTKFISSSPTSVNYNGRLPIVVYVPEGYEVRYKIFESNGTEYKAPVIMNNK